MKPVRKTTPRAAAKSAPACLPAAPAAQAGALADRPSTSPEPPAGPQPETILLAVTGMSPAILTETIWALVNPNDPDTEPIIPHRVIVITTTEGRSRLTQLFAPSTQLGGVSPWDALRNALAQQGHDLTGRLRFGQTGDDIRVITATDPASGRTRELADIRDRTDNEAAADFILEQVRAIVENPDTQLIASVAGGRKTMSALLYACMSLLGREADRLTHVLVSEPFETLRDFWFPSQPGGPLHPTTRSLGPVSSTATALDPATARLDLADVPFVPLRNLFERELSRKPGSFRRLIEECSRNLVARAAEELRLTVETTRPEIEVNGRRIRLAPLEHLLFLFLARRAKQGEPAYAAYKDAVEDLNVFRQEQLDAPKKFNDWRLAHSLRDPWDDHAITKAVSGIRDKLKHAGPDAALLAQCLPRKGSCALQLNSALIFIK